MTALRHVSGRIGPEELCPFCGRGPATAAARPRKAKRESADYLGPLRRAGLKWPGHGYVDLDAPVISPAYQAHIDAGERAVPDVSAGGYRWEKGQAA